MIEQTSPSFAEWLQTQLRARRMSQRQLADRSGVDHSTISRLTRSERSPSLHTATKLAQALGPMHLDGGGVPHLALVEPGPAHPLARVERALRSDHLLGEEQVRQVMRLYLTVRRLQTSADRTSAYRHAALRLEVPGAG